MQHHDPLYHQHDALSGNEFEPGIESVDPAEDRRMKHEILETVRSHPEVDGSRIKVDIKDGFVSLRGEASSQDEKETIGAIISNIEGVVDLVNFMEVKQDPSIQSSLKDGRPNFYDFDGDF